jgi:hypothetical protein
MKASELCDPYYKNVVWRHVSHNDADRGRDNPIGWLLKGCGFSSAAALSHGADANRAN